MVDAYASSSPESSCQARMKMGMLFMWLPYWLCRNNTSCGEIFAQPT
jgi:hypothetical protein